MRLNQWTKWTKIFLLSCSLLILAACSPHRRMQTQAVNDENSAYNSRGVQASGLGEDGGFGEQVANNRLIAKRVYYFDFNSNIVRNEDKPAIAANADYLIAHPKMNVMIEGHTDPRGSREYNIGLGERRARAVADILTARGVNPAQVRIVSYGAEKLASPGRSETDYQLDRRVVLVYLRR